MAGPLRPNPPPPSSLMAVVTLEKRLKKVVGIFTGLFHYFPKNRAISAQKWGGGRKKIVFRI